jgi:hypothetical protein
MGFGHWQGVIPLTKPNAGRPAKGYADRLLGGPGRIGQLVMRGAVPLSMDLSAVSRELRYRYRLLQ